MVQVPMIRRWRSNWPELRSLQRDMESLFDGLDWPVSGGALWSPAVDAEETEDALIFHAELPGMNMDDIQVDLEDGVLTIHGEKKHERGDETQGLLYERRWGTFTRKFTLPRAVDADNATANYENGVLTIHVPKAEEAKGRRIQIKAGEGRQVGSGS